METRVKQRIALSTYYFLSGFGFSTWTSRIPTIKEAIGLNDAELGSILLTMPIASLCGLPLSGFLVSRFNTRKPMLVGYLLYAVSLFSIGLASNTFSLIASMFAIAFFLRIVNVSMNTQVITVQKLFDRKINASFHALWSMGGIAGVGFTTLMIVSGIGMVTHLAIFACIAIPLAVAAYSHLIASDKSSGGTKLILNKPEPYIVSLGFIILFASICEGGMFDWSGVYFREVVHADIFTFGYLFFMFFMALSRLLADRVMHVLGTKKMFVLSASLLISGVLIAVMFPYFGPALIGFALIGLGTAPIVPIALAQAGGSKKYAAGIVVAIISTYGTTGMLIGPPIIGYLSQAFHLRWAFLFLIFAGLVIIPLSRLFFRIKGEE